MKMTVDLGNRNIKLCYKERGKISFDSFQSRFTTDEQLDYSNLEYVEIDGVKYAIEQGNYDFEFNKTEKTYLPLLLCAIARATSDEGIDLIIGSPAEHTLGLRDVFKEQLLGKTFEFKYNGLERRITINKVGVIGEGFATYFTIPKSTKSDVTNLGILDIGGRTVNVTTFINGKQDKVCTLNFGILDVKNDILKKLKQKGKDYDINTIENLIETDRLKIDEDYKVGLVDKIVNGCKMYKIDIDLIDKWYITGGGAIDIGSRVLDKTFGSNCIIEDALFSNVQGYYNFMIAKWGEE